MNSDLLAPESKVGSEWGYKNLTCDEPNVGKFVIVNIAWSDANKEEANNLLLHIFSSTSSKSTNVNP